jgi:hypothetical protein
VPFNIRFPLLFSKLPPAIVSTPLITGSALADKLPPALMVKDAPLFTVRLWMLLAAAVFKIG